MLLRAPKFILIFVLLLLSQISTALTVDFNVLYSTDALTETETGKNDRTFYDGAIMVNLTRKGQVAIGWSYASLALTDTYNSITRKYTSTEMGPRLGYYFDKEFVWSVFYTYNLVTTTKYATTPGSTVDWRGSGMKAELGFMPKWTEFLQLGLKFNYYAGTFKEEVSTSNMITDVSYKRTLMYPSIGLSYRFN